MRLLMVSSSYEALMQKPAYHSLKILIDVNIGYLLTIDLDWL